LLAFFLSEQSIMSSSEFSLIKQYFSKQQSSRKDVILGIGDDCAIVAPPANSHIAISTDTLVAGTHFLQDVDPKAVAYKALASNLSDLAAMGATPSWVSLALTMPEPDEKWLASFCEGFFELADYFGIQLIGGDTTKGPLSITLTVQGTVPNGEALLRSGAEIGDWIYVTGTLGDSAAGLSVILNEQPDSKPYAKVLERRHYYRQPRILAGQALRSVATSALDISDGLIADLGHILTSSNLSAEIDVDAIPLSAELIEFIGCKEQAQQLALQSGEEYELCFTVPEANKGMIETVMSHTGVSATCIGQVGAGSGITLLKQGEVLDWQLVGFDHFRSAS
jgi:thiamine-monophosphate kinase